MGKKLVSYSINEKEAISGVLAELVISALYFVNDKRSLRKKFT